jgi:carotenoid 1,2-hydratase
VDEDFDRPVVPGGYAWWYFDALSDDGERGFTAIFFRGSVFSPSYASRMRRGLAPSADEHLGVNLALYARGRQVAWVMSEYGARELGRADAGGLAIAGSSIERLPSGGLRVHIRERSAPFFAALGRLGTRIAGTVELEPLARPIGATALIGSDGRKHEWQVPMPRARVRVAMERPAFSFEGTGYHDLNRGDGRLEAAFSRWSWARFHPAERERTVILYSVRDRRGAPWALHVDTAQADVPRPMDASHDGPLRRAPWGLTLPRWFSVGDHLRCTPHDLLEAAPFYARYTGELTDGDGRVARGVGEYLDLDRFRGRGTQFLLRFKTRKVS